MTSLLSRVQGEVTNGPGFDVGTEDYICVTPHTSTPHTSVTPLHPAPAVTPHINLKQPTPIFTPDTNLYTLHQLCPPNRPPHT